MLTPTSVYRALLAVLPPTLRSRHGDEMVALYAELYDEVRAEGGRLAGWRFAAGALLRLLFVGAGSRLGALGPDSPTPRPTDPRFRERAMLGILRDLRFALRTLVRSPGYVAIVVVTLALAIGVNASIYSIVGTLLDPPLPYRAMEELVSPLSRNTELNRSTPAVSRADLEDLVAASAALESGGGRHGETVALTGGDEPVRLAASRVTVDYFRTLGVEPVAGRLFLPEEHLEGADRVVLLGEGARDRLFATGAPVLGVSVSIDGIEHTIVGVLPRALEITGAGDLYRPLAGGSGAPNDRDRRDLHAVARLAPGATIEQARTDLRRISQALQQEHPETNRGWELDARSLHEAMVGPNSRVVFSLMTLAVAFVLLIACANVAGLTLARAGQRARELSLRAALGAGRGSLVRTLLVESLLLGLAAGLLGLVVTRWIFAGLRFVGGGQVTLFDRLRLDPDVLLFTLLLALATPLVFGLWPALRVCRRDLHLALRSGGPAGADIQRVRRVMVVGQVAMAVTLLIVAGLATRSVAALLSVELGFDPDRLMSFRLTLDSVPTAEAPDRFEAFGAEIARLPGVRAVGLANVRPVVRAAPTQSLSIDGRPDGDADRGSVERVVADPGLFATLGLPALRGRVIEQRDGADDLPVAVIGRAAADRYWPEGDPIGERIRLGERDAWRTVVGVVADVRNADADRPPEPRVYVPLAQAPTSAMAFLVRTEGAPADLADAMRAAIWRLDPRQPVDDMRTMARIRIDDLAGDLAIIGLLACFALVAFVLSVAGVYSIVSYSVTQRTREIGIRMAVGARAGDVRRLVTRQGVRMVAGGAAIGLAAGLLLSRLISGMLYGISSLDPVTFVGVPMALLAVGLLAAAVPARRATRLDPALTLRAE